MSGPPRYHPSRRSRFRAQDSGGTRPADSAPTDPVDDLTALPSHEQTLSMPEHKDDPDAPVPEAAAEAALSMPEHAVDPNAPPPETLPGSWPVEVYTPEAYTPSHAVPVAESSATLTLPAAPLEAAEELPRAFQLRNVYEGPAPLRRGLIAFYLTLGSVALLGAGLTTGYLLGAHGRPTQRVVVAGVAALPGKAVVPLPISDEMQAALDAAFEATKQRHYQEAQKMFAALHAAHPEWPSMAIESARDALYQMDAQATGSILSSLTRYGPQADAEFMQALLHLTHKEFDAAGRRFAAAVALDPARPDFYYFWGECLRDEGKPREAAEKFRAALLRNQYETAEDLYQLKLWLSEIQAEEETANGTNAKIDAALTMTPRPPYSAVFADAARKMKANHFDEAAKLFAQAQQLTEPVVFRVITQDPMFVQESWRPELAKFYQ